MTTDESLGNGPDLAAGIPATELGEGTMLEGHVGGDAVVVARYHGTVYAVGAKCTHYGGPLAEGILVDGTIRCPWHHAAFDLQTGAVRRPPALDPIPCWKVREENGRIVVAGRKDPAPPRATPSVSVPATPESIVILGGGAAGLYAAETLRREGYDRAITMIEAGPDAPYDRPNLSKDYLAGTASEEWIPLRAPGWYAENEVELLLNSEVTAIDPAARTVQLEDGTARPFGALLIATGAEPVRLDPDVARGKVHYLRTLGHSRALIAAAGHARSVVILGASFIGLEVAAALRERNLDVTVVAPDERPLERVFGPELADFIRRLHEDHGVRFRLGRKAAVVEDGRVVLDDGTVLQADLVVAGIGVRPRVALAERAGLTMDRGILVDEYLQTSAPGIYAAGDVARWPDARTGDRIRVEHWVLAQRQAQTAAINMMGGARRERFTAAPFFWSRHYDLSIDYTGHAERWTAVEVNGDLAARDASVTYRNGERADAVATLHRDRVSLASEARMEAAAAAAAAGRK
ncbi:MAG: FAD-dependent oxidoreductase [Gemmatimonadota bacterium]